MDGTIHRTKRQNAKRPFPWGDVIIWASGIAALLMLFRLGGVVGEFLYGVAGIYIYCVFIITAVLGICLRTGKRVHVNPQYFWGSVIMLFAFFTAMHVGFTQTVVSGGKNTDLSGYLDYCFSNLTPGGVLFALPSYLLLVISGTVGTYLLLSVLYLFGLILVVNRVITKNREHNIVTLETKEQEEVVTDNYAKNTAELYEKLQMASKEIMRENRRNFDANKSLLGLGALPKQENVKAKTGNPVSLKDLTSPDAINQASGEAANAVQPGLQMYNNGVAIPWRGLDSANWSGVQSTVTPSPVSPDLQMPTTGASAYPYMPSPVMPLSNSMIQPTTPPQPTPTNVWGQTNNMQWQSGSGNWTPPSSPEVTPTTPSVNRRRNSSVIQNLNNQTSLSLEIPNNAKEPAMETFKNKRYIKPTLDLIHTQSMDLSQFNEEASEKETKLNELFQQYNVRARVHNFSVAPAVTRFEIVPELGTRVAQIENLRDDMNFVLKTNNTRMESPIEGKNAIGIEVPNHTIGTVSIKDLLGSREFISHKSPLAICVGKNINDEPIIADLAEMPHLLVAGTTGSGKSVCINTIITSLIFKSSPEELKLMLIDMKGGVELGMYNGLPHMLVERCISNVTHAVNAFKWLI
ncbi:MAG: hypothetical protein MJ054_02505, partial [Clostridia bacterium]|nr:hypothetical protein [Clostridia bacterium]